MMVSNGGVRAPLPRLYWALESLSVRQVGRILGLTSQEVYWEIAEGTVPRCWDEFRDEMRVPAWDLYEAVYIDRTLVPVVDFSVGYTPEQLVDFGCYVSEQARCEPAAQDAGVAS